MTEHLSMAAHFLVLLLFMIMPTAKAVEKTDYIDTNRPSLTQSALVVPMGAIQLENGSLYQHFQHGLTYFNVPETEIRVGLLKGTELQIYAPQFIMLNQSSSTYGGASQFGEVGIKQQIGPFKRFAASAIAGVNIPTGNKLISGSDVQPVFRIPYAVSVTSNWKFCGMQSIIVTNSHGDILYEPFVMACRSFGRRATAFAEYVGFFTQNAHAPGIQIAHFGGLYKLNRHNQIDIQFGFGMSKSAPAALVGAGYSYRFDKLPW